MPKAIKTTLKLNLPAGSATPAPPVGPALGQHGVPIMDFVNKYNQATQDKKGQIVPVEITIYEDRSFDFVVKTPPASSLLIEAAGIEKGSGEPHANKVGTVTQKQVEKIAETKLPDLNTGNLKQAMKIVEGTARSMGIEVVE